MMGLNGAETLYLVPNHRDLYSAHRILKTLVEDRQCSSSNNSRLEAMEINPSRRHAASQPDSHRPSIGSLLANVPDLVKQDLPSTLGRRRRRTQRQVSPGYSPIDRKLPSDGLFPPRQTPAAQ